MAEIQNIDGFSLRNILENAKDLLGSKIYEKALQVSQLERFKQELPAAVPTPAATSTELTNFWKAVYEQTTPSTFKLFQRNLGDKLAEAGQKGETIQQVREKLLALPKEQRLTEAVANTSYLINMGGVHTSYEAHEQGFLLYFDICPFICHTVKTPEPLCQMYEFMFLKFLKWFTHLPLVSNEIECIAMGNAACRYYFWEVK